MLVNAQGRTVQHLLDAAHNIFELFDGVVVGFAAHFVTHRYLVLKLGVARNARELRKNHLDLHEHGVR